MLPPAAPPRPPWADPTVTLRLAASVVVILAGGWWLLNQLAPVLRPLLLAVFLGYVLMPYYTRLRRHVPGPVAITFLAGLTTAALVGLALAVAAGVGELQREGPQLRARAVGMIRDGLDWAEATLPTRGFGTGEAARPLGETAAGWATDYALMFLNLAAVGALEAAAVGLYLLFLLLESARFPDRVRAAFPPEKADHVLHVFGRINAAIISYLKAKVLSSLALAVPVGVVLAGCGVRFAPLWAVLTFACNFIPYLGSVVAYSIPVGFAFLQFGPAWQPFAAAGLLLGCHVATAAVVEPTILGRAVGLSPLVILAALSVWGLLWGLPGMFLAVPLTVVAVLVLDNIEVTRPLARLLGGG